MTATARRGPRQPGPGGPTRVAIIGPGRVGTTLALALPRHRYEIAAVAGRGPASVAEFSRRFPAVRATTAAAAAAAADLVLLCVPDDVLPGLVRDLASDDAVAEGSRWVHVSGRYGLAALHLAALAGARTAACHPAQTFPDPDAGADTLRGCAWAVTAAVADRGWASALVEELGGSPVDVTDGARTLYHAALAVGANGTAAVVTLARDLLLAAGIDTPEGFLRPLTRAAAEHAAGRGPAALTGPVRRGDAGTVAAHLAELRTVLPEDAGAYVDLSRLALRHARRAGLDPERADAIERLLQEAT